MKWKCSGCRIQVYTICVSYPTLRQRRAREMYFYLLYYYYYYFNFKIFGLRKIKKKTLMKTHFIFTAIKSAYMCERWWCVWGAGKGFCITEHVTHECTHIKLGCLITPEMLHWGRLAEWNEAGRQGKKEHRQCVLDRHEKRADPISGMKWNKIFPK